ncbi:Ni/Fe hydrogenase subunit alpha [Candidatus Woesearchaeota archaeon]|nr:Ni/Fe hydrogenase subunit alpha [Candidatus Woesearchaeota archaeon]
MAKKKTLKQSKKITLNHLCKVEGHGALDLKIVNGKVKVCRLNAIEGARYFEGLVRDRLYDEINEITSRICGICSVAHNMTCLKAIERAMDVPVSEQTQILRELLSIAERVRSHATHLYFLALPDYLGFESAIAMAAKYKTEVNRALQLMKVGNVMAETIGGREMHPVTCIVGGFTKVPDKDEKKMLLDNLKEALPQAIKTAELFSKIEYPAFERECEHMALYQDKKISLLEGTIVSDWGHSSPQENYNDYVTERLEPYATSKFATKQGKEYMVGALSRLNTNLDALSPTAKKILLKGKHAIPSQNPFINNYAQALELVHWIERAILLLSENDFIFEGLPEVNVKAGHGIAVTEAPRGLLFHEYEFDREGRVIRANIITPTAQNLSNMEQDIKGYVEFLLAQQKMSNDKLVLEIEKLIRSYDPCFSCSTHFLKVNWV